MKENESEQPEMDFMDAMMNLARAATSQQQQLPTFSINRNRTVNHITVDINVTTQPQQGFLRRIFSKIF